MHYSICTPADAAAASILGAVLASMRTDKRMQADLAKLDRACCTRQALVVLEGAPRPALIASPAEG